MAIEEIYKDIAKKAVVAKEIGPTGWKAPLPLKANKRFLHNTLQSAVKYNKRKTMEEMEKSKEKLERQNHKRKRKQ